MSFQQTENATATRETVGRIPSASFFDNLLFNLAYVIPMALQGTFTRNKFWVGFWTRFHPDFAAVRFVQRLRRQYRSNRVYLRLLTTKSLLVTAAEDVRHVLQHSPYTFADSKLKRDGMNIFQPNAVTISRDAEWQDRRRFNDAVLGFGHPIHSFAEHFLGIIHSTLDALVGSAPASLVWQHLERAFQEIMLGVIFGNSARGDSEFATLLTLMMREANSVLKPKKSKYFDPFYSRMHAYIDTAEDKSLVSLFREVPSSEMTRIENQIPHWMFAMSETLSINTARAMAVIVAHPDAYERVKHELSMAEIATPQGVDDLKYLSGCLQEAMRLWPTTPMLLRTSIADDEIGGLPVPSNTQLIILNSFNHRDSETNPLANLFAPDIWTNPGTHPLYNHLSSGPQVCAGKDLALFIGKAVLASLLRRGHFALRSPVLNVRRPLPFAFNHFRLRLVNIK